MKQLFSQKDLKKLAGTYRCFCTSHWLYMEREIGNSARLLLICPPSRQTQFSEAGLEMSPGCQHGKKGKGRMALQVFTFYSSISKIVLET